MDNVIRGNVEGVSKKGWFFGHFMDHFPQFQSKDFELKWSRYKSGDKKQDGPRLNVKASTISILISGKFTVKFPQSGETVTLEKPGDFVFFGPGVRHDWISTEESHMLTVRWPSIRGDQI